MSFPWRAAGNCLAITSHFFEFAEPDSEGGQSPLKLAHELEIGRRYSILLTTSGGLYRYRIGDVAEVVGHIGQCPLLQFKGKEDGVVDLVGEKLNAMHVARAAQEVFARFTFNQRFWMLAPDHSQTPRCYVLYLQSDSPVPSGALTSFETLLEENFHYAYARRLGQLGPLQLFLIDPASDPEAITSRPARRAASAWAISNDIAWIGMTGGPECSDAGRMDSEHWRVDEIRVPL